MRRDEVEVGGVYALSYRSSSRRGEPMGSKVGVKVEVVEKDVQHGVYRDSPSKTMLRVKPLDNTQWALDEDGCIKRRIEARELIATWEAYEPVRQAYLAEQRAQREERQRREDELSRRYDGIEDAFFTQSIVSDRSTMHARVNGRSRRVAIVNLALSDAEHLALVVRALNDIAAAADQPGDAALFHVTKSALASVAESAAALREAHQQSEEAA